MEFLQRGPPRGRRLLRAGIHFINIMAFNPGDAVEPIGELERTLMLGPISRDSNLFNWSGVRLGPWYD